MAAKVLHVAPFAERDAAHQELERAIARGATEATCTQNATHVIVWDSAPTEAERVAAEVRAVR